jgi:hypothetical protein
MKGGGDAEEAAVDGGVTVFMETEGDHSNSDEKLPFWSDHAFGTQRFQDIACWINGHDEQEHSDLVEDRILPVEKSSSCRRKWEKVSRAWARLLEPFERK